MSPVERRGRSEGAGPRGWGRSALGPAPSGPAPPGSLPAPPAVPWPQSRRCRPMNGVAFCLVGIPPRPEPRPPQVRALGQGRGADPGAAGELAAGGRGRGALARRAQPGGARCGHRGHGCWELRLVVGRGGSRSESCPGQGAGRRKAGRGPGRARGCQGRGHRPGQPCQAPSGRAAGAGGPRLLSGFFRRGACRCFLCPSFRFPLARPRHSWSEREWGRGFPERDVLGHWGRTPPSPRHTRPLPGRAARRASGSWVCRPTGSWDRDPGSRGLCCPPLCPLGLAVGGSGRGVPGALLSAGLLCLDSFICQLLKLGMGQQGPPGPFGASPLPPSLAALGLLEYPNTHHPPSQVEGLGTVRPALSQFGRVS